MPSSTVGPGTRLASRYRLEDHVSETGATSTWRAVDEALGRDVTVRTLPVDSPDAEPVTRAARAAAAVLDHRFLRVLDVDADQDHVYVVSEWSGGQTLEAALQSGPLAPRDAVRVVAQVAEALAAAGRQGLHHGCLRPDRVVLTEAGQVRLGGLLVDAAVAHCPGPESREAAALADAHGCGRLLYAALTARWPEDGFATSALTPAPAIDGHPASPRQVRAGVPASLDTIAARAMGTRVSGREPALTTPSAIAAALSTARVPAEPALEDGPGAPTMLLGQPGPAPEPMAAPTGAARTSRAAGVLVALVVLVAVGLLGWQLVLAALDGRGATARGDSGSGPTQAAQPTPTGTVVPVRGVEDFDPEGNGSENPDEVRRAVDGDPATGWHTLTYYNRPDLGGLKSGVGLLLDLGSVQQVSTVTVDLVGRGTTLELRGATNRSDSASGYSTIATAKDAGPTVTLRAPSPVRARYLLLWFTQLPPDGNGDYKGGVDEVTVRR